MRLPMEGGSRPHHVCGRQEAVHARAADRGLVGLLPAGAAAQARAEALTAWPSAAATRRTPSSVSSGYIGSERTRSAADSVTGKEPGPKPASRYASWRWIGTG